ncbi:MAG: DUF2206 domain-containing protein [Methanobacterium sp.]
MNDWKFSQFIKSVILVQILVLIINGLNLNGINVPIISQLISFIYLTFIPGFLILRIMRVHKIGNVKSILYSAGLSIISVMFLGFIINLFFPMVGITKPMSILPLLTVITIYVIILSILSYIRDKDFSSPDLIDTGDLMSPIFLFLCITPFLAIFGSYLMTFYNNNLISVVLIIVLVLITILTVFNKIPQKLYPFTIWILSISLLYDSSLVSTYIWGWDIQNEFFLASNVLNNFYWNFGFNDAYNAMLSVVMLAPIYSIFTNMDLVYVLKVICPLLFSFVPIGLYKIYKSQTPPKIAFLACFLFISFYTFFIEMLALAREMIAEIFLILILLVIFTDQIKKNTRVLFVLFALGLVISHYSLTYFSLFILISTFILLLIYYFYKWFVKDNDNTISFYLRKLNNSPINIFLVILVAAFMYLWYGNVAQGAALRGLTDAFTVINYDVTQKIVLITAKIGLFGFYLGIMAILLLIISIIFLIFKYRKNIAKKGSLRADVKDLLNPVIGSKWKHHIFAILSIIILVVLVFLVGKPQTWIVGVLRYLNFAAVFFTLVGLFMLFLGLSKHKFTREYLTLSLLSFMVLLTGIFVPAFENSFNITRIFEMTFVFLAPICVVGGIIVFKSILKVFKIDVIKDNSIKVFSVFLILLLLFNAGFFSVLTNQSIPMHLSKESDYYPSFNVPETTAAAWLHNESAGPVIFADSYGIFVFYKYYYPAELNVISKYNGNINSYIFLRKLNQQNKLLIGFEKGSRDRSRVYEDRSNIINSKYRIYHNGDASIYFS